MVAVRRGLGAALVVAVVLVGLLAHATAYLAGFTTPAPARAGAVEGLPHAVPGSHQVGVRRLPVDGPTPALTVWYPASVVPADGHRLTHAPGQLSHLPTARVPMS